MQIPQDLTARSSLQLPEPRGGAERAAHLKGDRALVLFRDEPEGQERTTDPLLLEDGRRFGHESGTVGEYAAISPLRGIRPSPAIEGSPRPAPGRTDLWKWRPSSWRSPRVRPCPLRPRGRSVSRGNAFVRRRPRPGPRPLRRRRPRPRRR